MTTTSPPAPDQLSKVRSADELIAELRTLIMRTFIMYTVALIILIDLRYKKPAR